MVSSRATILILFSEGFKLLFINAAKYSPEGKAYEIAVSMDEQDLFKEFLVGDQRWVKLVMPTETQDLLTGMRQSSAL